jgi:RNA polymerase sigma factor (sigma-70 family)
VSHDPRRRKFELLALPHLDAAFNFARWLAGNSADAEDIVQEAYLRGWRYFDSFRGGDMRVWLLAIVRTCFLSWIKDNRSPRLVFFAEEPAGADEATAWTEPPLDPEALLLDRVDSVVLADLVAKLPGEYREVLLLREMEDLSYRDIAEITGTPIGTVMSRLARARMALRKLWQEAGNAV